MSGVPESGLQDKTPPKPYFAAIASAGLALAIYAVTLGGTYIYDDVFIVQKDTRISNPHLWGQFWTKDYFNGGIDNLYRPLVSMSYAMQWWLHGDKPWAFHLVNVLLNAAVCAAVAELARRMFRSRVAYLAGFLFAAHPIHTEVVAGIVGRAELMVTLATLVALILFMHRPMTIRRAFAIWGCFLVALLSKEQGMLLPLVLLVWEMIRRWMSRQNARATKPRALGMASNMLEYAGRDLQRKESREGMLWLIVLLCFTLAAYIVFRESILKFWWNRGFLDWTINPLGDLTRVSDRERMLIPLTLLGRYVVLLVAPLRLSIEYGTAIPVHVTWSDPYLLLGTATIFLWLVGVALAVWFRKGAALFCLLSLAIFYAVIGNYFTIIGTIFGERLMYLPSVFFLILVASAIARLRRGARIGLAVVIILLLGARTFSYALEWNDRLKFYQTSLERNPDSIRLYVLLADELQKHGDLEGAKATLARGREVTPDYWRLWIQSSVLAMDMNELDEAERFFRRATEIEPRAHFANIPEKLAAKRAATRASTQKS